ncbi:hypothetical protein [Streptomyces sp. NBC_01518]|uniref:hypothetical protein n=1 Tax=Streptomyces sp. NBC_01518 TaxID=2903891 RepID=UPI00386E2CD3
MGKAGTFPADQPADLGRGGGAGRGGGQDFVVDDAVGDAGIFAQQELGLVAGEQAEVDVEEVVDDPVPEA